MFFQLYFCLQLKKESEVLLNPPSTTEPEEISKGRDTFLTKEKLEEVETDLKTPKIKVISKVYK